LYLTVLRYIVKFRPKLIHKIDPRTLWHLHYTDWGEHGCPTDTRAYLEFLEEVASLRQHINSSPATSSSTLTSSSKSPKSASKARNPPVLVHCSAGVGRTGVAILCDILLYCVDHNVDVDIPKILGHLRQQRMLMVQTVAQYKFVHTVIIHYLKQSRLI
jgi:tyrosine-protein phosphatase non-receptor type 14/21